MRLRLGQLIACAMLVGGVAGASETRELRKVAELRLEDAKGDPLIDRWLRLSASGGSVYLLGAAIDSFDAADLRGDMRGWPPSHRRVERRDTGGRPDAFFTSVQFPDSQVLAYNLRTSALHCVDADGIGPPLDGTGSCRGMSRVDGTRLVCAVSSTLHRARPGFLVDVRGIDLVPQLSFYPADRLRPFAERQVHVASTAGRIFVAHALSLEVRVFEADGSELKPLDCSWGGYKAPIKPMDQFPGERRRERWRSWWQSWTPCVSLIAGSGMLAVQFFVGEMGDSSRFHLILFDALSGRRLLEGEYPLLEAIDADRFFFLAQGAASSPRPCPPLRETAMQSSRGIRRAEAR